MAPDTAASIPYEGTDCTPEEAVEAVKAVRATAAFDSCYYCLAPVEKCGTLCDGCQAKIDHARDLGSRDCYAD